MKKLIVFDLDPKPPIRFDIGHADKFHILLQMNDGGQAPADHPVYVNSNTNFSSYDYINFVGGWSAYSNLQKPRRRVTSFHH